MKIIKTSNTHKDILVDDYNYERLYNLSKIIAFCDSGRAVQLSIRRHRKTFTIPLTKIILLTDEDVVDHDDRNYLNNQVYNLKPRSYRENALNKNRKINNKSGFIGVHWYKAYNKWQVQVQHKRKLYHIGYFSDIIEAAKAYDRKALELHGNLVQLNFPDE